MPIGYDYPDPDDQIDLSKLSAERQKLIAAAREQNHPDPINATWGEVNVLAIESFGVPFDRAEAKRRLRIAEFDADFNS